MQTKVVSTFNPLTGQTGGAAHFLLLANDGSLPIIQRIDGYMNGVANTQYWLQFFAATTVPADTAVPLFELQVIGLNGFSWFFGDNGQNFAKLADLPTGTANLIVAVSSTSGTLTSSAVTMDLEV